MFYQMLTYWPRNPIPEVDYYDSEAEALAAKAEFELAGASCEIATTDSDECPFQQGTLDMHY